MENFSSWRRSLVPRLSGEMTTSRATLAFACGSKSITSTFFSRSTSAPARLITVVVFPTPPLLLATLMMRGRVGAGFVIPFPFCLYRSKAIYILYNMTRQGKLQRFCSGYRVPRAMDVPQHILLPTDVKVLFSLGPVSIHHETGGDLGFARG